MDAITSIASKIEFFEPSKKATSLIWSPNIKQVKVEDNKANDKEKRIKNQKKNYLTNSVTNSENNRKDNMDKIEKKGKDHKNRKNKTEKKSRNEKKNHRNNSENRKDNIKKKGKDNKNGKDKSEKKSRNGEKKNQDMKNINEKKRKRDSLSNDSSKKQKKPKLAITNKKLEYTDFFSDSLNNPNNPSISDLKEQFLEEGITQMRKGIKEDYMAKLNTYIKLRYDMIMNTVTILDLHDKLENGFIEFKPRGYGRYDMQLMEDHFPFLFSNKSPWMKLVYDILGNNAKLTYVGCIISTPTSMAQPWHSDGSHLSEKKYLPPHCLNVFVPLVDLTRINGATQFQPKSHKELDFDSGDKDSICITAKAGQAILFDYRLRHRGLGNNSSTTRNLLYFTYAQPHFAKDKNFTAKKYTPLPKLIEMSGRRSFQLEDVIEKSDKTKQHKKETKLSQEQLFESITNAAKRNVLSNLNMVLDESEVTSSYDGNACSYDESEDCANSCDSETLSF